MKVRKKPHGHLVILDMKLIRTSRLLMAAIDDFELVKLGQTSL